MPSLTSSSTANSALIANGHWALAFPADYTVLPVVSGTTGTGGEFYLQTSAGACYASTSTPLLCAPFDIVPRAKFRLVCTLGPVPYSALTHARSLELFQVTTTVSNTPALLELVGGTYNWSADARPTNTTGVSVYNGALTATRPVVFTIAVTPVATPLAA